VARLAIGKTIVVNGDIGPGLGAVVTVGALTDIVTWRCIGGVTPLTISKLIVAKGNVSPVIRVVTIGALAVIVIRRCINGMARPAIIWQAGVFDVTPIVGIVAIRALTTRGDVSIRALVARLAISVGYVVKGDIGPIVNGVTTGALSGPVATRWFVTR